MQTRKTPGNAVSVDQKVPELLSSASPTAVGFGNRSCSIGTCHGEALLRCGSLDCPDRCCKFLGLPLLAAFRVGVWGPATSRITVMGRDLLGVECTAGNCEEPCRPLGAIEAVRSGRVEPGTVGRVRSALNDGACFPMALSGGWCVGRVPRLRCLRGSGSSASLLS